MKLALSLLGKRQRLTFFLLMVERVIVGFCDLLLAGAMYLLFLLLQRAAPTHHGWWTPKSTLSSAFVTATLILVRVLLDLVSTRSIVGYIQEIYTGILLRLTHGYNEMQWVRLAQRNRSELLNHAMYTAREASNFYHLGIEMAASSIVIVGMTGAVIYQSPAAACGIGLAAGMLYCVHQFLIRRKLERYATEREGALRILQRSLADMFSSGKELRSYGVEGFFAKRIAAHAESAAAGHRNVALLPQVARILTDQGVVLLFLCVVIAVELRHGDVRQLLSVLMFYFVLSRRLLPLISQISFMAGQMESSYKNVQMIAGELDECSMYRAAQPVAQRTDGGVLAELDQISFAFHEGVPILRSVSLCLRRGETVRLRGRSGCGKSSLLSIIAGVLQSASGTIRIDRTRVAYVPQDVILLDDSIRNNLLFGRHVEGDADLRQALAVANLEDFVAAQPLGLDTQVGDNGILFSGGQRQRLGLARALVGAANLLLLDEATSALDEETESKVLANLRASGVAVLLVTHRSLRKEFAQRILRLEDGCLIEEFMPELSSLEPEAVAEAV